MYIHYHFINAGDSGICKWDNTTLTVYKCVPEPTEGTHIAQLALDGTAVVVGESQVRKYVRDGM